MHLVGYVPYRDVKDLDNWRELYPNTWRIMDFKAGQPEQVSYFTELAVAALDERLDLGPSWGATVVPSSRREEWGEGLLAIVSELNRLYDVQDCGKALCRHQSIQKLASGGDRSKRQHRGTIALMREPLPDHIILIDDVASTGNSLAVCAEILKAAGVKEVFTIALAETTNA